MAEFYISLPFLYDSWPQLRDNLNLLASKSIRGITAFEEVLQRDDRWENVKLPMTQLRIALKESRGVCTLDHFCDMLMPWIANTALKVEELFKDSGHKLKVSSN
jgi:hypothetical protein